MAGLLLRSITNLGRRTTPRLLRNVDRVLAATVDRRHLYEEAMLSVVSQKDTKQMFLERINQQKDYFIGEMKANKEGQVYTEDLKTVVHIAETEEELDVAVDMLRRYTEVYSKENREPDYKIGPVMMRTLHMNGKPQLAKELFMDESLFSTIFRHLTSYVLLVDMLYEEEMYEDVIEVGDFKAKKMGWNYMAGPHVIALLASCYKLDTPESYEKAKGYINALLENNRTPIWRAFRIPVYYALKRGDIEQAEAFLKQADEYYRVDEKVVDPFDDMKILMYCKQGKGEEALQKCESLYNNPRSPRLHIDVVEALADAVSKLEDEQKEAKFRELLSQMKLLNRLSDRRMDDLMLHSLVKNRVSMGQRRNRTEGAQNS